MSLGWNTESALLPSKAKKIDVDSSSMLDLKAIVSEREELMRQRQAEKHPDELRQHRGVATAPARPDDFARVNRGIEARKEADLNAKEAEKAVKSNNLERKAQLYEKLKRGEVDPEAAKRAGFLVDFQQAQSSDSKGGAEARWTAEGAEALRSVVGFDEADAEGPSAEARGRKNPDTVEVEDEFGRVMQVKIGSKAHVELLSAKASAQRAEALEAARQQDHLAKRQRVEAGPESFPVSSGAVHGRDERSEGGQGLRDFDHGGPAGGAAFGATSGAEIDVVSGGVKSRWEQTLTSEEKGYLAAISLETQAERTKRGVGEAVGLGSVGRAQTAASQPAKSQSAQKAAPVRRDPKAARLELLKKKAASKKAAQQQAPS